MKGSRFEKLLHRYDYDFPSGCIASAPASPRDSARLMVYDRKSGRVADATFRDLPKFLPRGALLVFNDTKVIPARLTLMKPTGGLVRVLFIDLAGKCLRVLVDRPVSLGRDLLLNKKPAFRAIGREGKYLIFAPLIRGNLRNFLERNGEAPLPPYIKNTPLTKKEQRRRYQTVFAKTPGSIAAPTASLHFTQGLLRLLKKSGVETTFVTLHVGLGTFASLTPENVKLGSLHEEEYSINGKTADALNRAIRDGRPIIPVGTTALRTLESAIVGGKINPVRNFKLGVRDLSNKLSQMKYSSQDDLGTISNGIKKLHGKTSLFIREGYRFRVAHGLITNFHVPRSSLLMLVSAFAGRENVLKLYQRAIKRGYRFFSFGDGMLIS